jgi:uncharacterized membrane protein
MTEQELYAEAQRRIAQYTDGAITLHELINTLSILELQNPELAQPFQAL